ncbi:MAG: ribulose-phosphate 3-epimerase [Bacillota bacterium]|nr:ribulose-phosphate 3-epimerase [Bacillota bacterium]
MIKIAPSILSADFAKLGAEIEDIKAGGADYVHFDVMDGEFVPNISIGVPVLKSIRKVTDMFLDVHLMIDRPVRYAEVFCKSGADLVMFHVESDTPENIEKAIEIVKSNGKKVGLSVKPKTPASALYPFIDELDMVLVMTVEPGFGGQSFMHDQLPKIKEFREEIDRRGLDCELEVDGGVDPVTAKLVKDAGANILVAGSAVFGKADRAAQINAIRNA